MEREHFIPTETSEKIGEKHTTDTALLEKVDKVINVFCKNFTVEGKENLPEKEDAKFIIASSHISNLDAPAAVKALGDKFDVQITTESVLHEGLMPQRVLFKMAGSEHFSKLTYKKDKKTTVGKKGVFEPEDFKILAEQMDKGKTPWMAIHPFTTKNEIQDARIGSVYLAQKTGAKIIPTALEMKGGGSINMEGGVEITKALTKKADAVYHIGEPIELSPLDINIIEKVLAKRTMGKKVTPEEKAEFSRVYEELKKQSFEVAQKIAAMLPEEQRGKYSLK